MERYTPENFKWAKVFGAAIVLTAPLIESAISPAQAATCLQNVRDIARQYDLTIDPPNADPESNEAIAADKEASGILGESGGIIEPPSSSDPAVIEPPEVSGNRMPTVPDVSNSDSSPSGQTDGAAPLDLSILETILISARSEALRGQEDDCLELLNNARQVIQRSEP